MLPMLRHYMNKTVLTEGRGYVYSHVHINIFVPGNTFSPVLVGRCSAHATASHAQDCPDWKLGENSLSYSPCINVFISGNALLWPCSGIIVLVLWHHTHKTVLMGIWRRPTFTLYVSHQNKLIRTGWTYLVEFLCSSRKLLP